MQVRRAGALRARDMAHWPLLLAIGLSTGVATAGATSPPVRCTWTDPGHNPFMGDVAARHARARTGVLRGSALHPGAHGCRNVSRISRERPAVAARQATATGDEGAGVGSLPPGALRLPGSEVVAPASFAAGLTTAEVAAAAEDVQAAGVNGPPIDPGAGIGWPAADWRQPDSDGWLDGRWPAGTAVVPEPGSWALMLAGLAGLGRRIARRCRAPAGVSPA